MTFRRHRLGVVPAGVLVVVLPLVGVLRRFLRCPGVWGRVGSGWACGGAAEEGGGEGEPPSTETIVRTALARVPVSGAGLSWQPRKKSYTNVGVPTIVYAASPTQSHTTALFGREVVITLTASRYSYDFGDSTPPLVTTRAGEPWRRGNKEARLTHHYEETTRGGERRTITLTTTWDATTTNPFTGQTLTLPSIITTTEQSSPFPVSHLRIDLTDTADEQDGH